MKRFILSSLIALCLFFLQVGAQAGVDEVPPWQVIGRYDHPPILESSGVVASKQFPEVYWTLNDSGNPPVLYATTLEGELINEVPVTGARNRD